MTVIFLETSRHERFSPDFRSAIDHDTLLRCGFSRLSVRYSQRFSNIYEQLFSVITILTTAETLVSPTFLNFAWQKNAKESSE